MQRGVTREEEENPTVEKRGERVGGGGASTVARVEKGTLLLQE